MNNESAGLGSGYDYASVNFTGNATLRPIIGPRDGIGTNALADLKSSSVMINAKPNGSESGTFNITNDLFIEIFNSSINISSNHTNKDHHDGQDGMQFVLLIFLFCMFGLIG